MGLLDKTLKYNEIIFYKSGTIIYSTMNGVFFLHTPTSNEILNVSHLKVNIEELQCCYNGSSHMK